MTTGGAEGEGSSKETDEVVHLGGEVVGAVLGNLADKEEVVGDGSTEKMLFHTGDRFVVHFLVDMLFLSRLQILLDQVLYKK